jgi:hypothetical protein
MAPEKKATNKSTTQKVTTAHKPAAEPTTTNQPMPMSPKTNTMAVIALVLAFFIPLIGLILGIVAISQIKKKNEGGKGLAIASIIISIVIMLMQVIAVMAIAGGIFAAKNELNRQGVNINANNGTIDVKGEDGDSASIGNAKVPSGFPSDVPIYPGSKVSGSFKSGDNKYTVILTTTDSKNKVDSYYKSQLSANGWISDDSTGSADFGSFSGTTLSKGSQQLLVTTVDDKDNKGAGITLSVYPKEQ